MLNVPKGKFRTKITKILHWRLPTWHLRSYARRLATGMSWPTPKMMLFWRLIWNLDINKKIVKQLCILEEIVSITLRNKIVLSVHWRIVFLKFKSGIEMPFRQPFDWTWLTKIKRVSAARFNNKGKREHHYWRPQFIENIGTEDPLTRTETGATEIQWEIHRIHRDPKPIFKRTRRRKC